MELLKVYRVISLYENYQRIWTFDPGIKWIKSKINYWSKDGFEDEILESDPLPSLIEGGENFAFK